MSILDSRIDRLYYIKDQWKKIAKQDQKLYWIKSNDERTKEKNDDGRKVERAKNIIISRNNINISQ